MSNLTGSVPGGDLPEPDLPQPAGNDVPGVPGGGVGFGDDLPTKPAGTNPANEPDPTDPSTVAAAFAGL